jgi:hypothetical protein
MRRHNLEDLGIERVYLLKQIEKKWGKVWSGLKWLRAGSSDWLL